MSPTPEDIPPAPSDGDFPVVPSGGDSEKDTAWRYAVHYGLKRLKEELAETNRRLTETRSKLFALEKRVLIWIAVSGGAGFGGGFGLKWLIGG